MISRWNLPPDFTRTRPIQWDSSWPESAEGDRSLIFSYLDERFGIPKSVFKDFILFRKRSGWWLLKRSIHLSDAASLKVMSTGLKSFQRIGAFIKPTTRFIQLFGYYARRSILEVTEEELKGLLSGNPLGVKMKIDNGYVIIEISGCIVGLGLLIGEKVRMQVHKRRMSDLMAVSL